MDQIADLLVRIKNASLVGKTEVTTTFSKMKEAILNILKNEGFLTDIAIIEENNKRYLKASLSLKKIPSHIKQISKSGRRIYAKNKEIPTPLRGLGTVIISTSTGLTTGKVARKSGLGGELICEIW